MFNKHPIDSFKKDTKTSSPLRDNNDNNNNNDDELQPLTEYLCLVCQTFSFIFKQFQTTTTTTTTTTTINQRVQYDTEKILNNLDLKFPKKFCELFLHVIRGLYSKLEYNENSSDLITSDSISLGIHYYINFNSVNILFIVFDINSIYFINYLFIYLFIYVKHTQ